jgi:hypothetical protein
MLALLLEQAIADAIQVVPDKKGNVEPEPIRIAIIKPGFVLETEWRINQENQARARNQKMW